MPVDVLQWSLAQFQSFLLILMRVAPILFLMPLLGARNVPSAGQDRAGAHREPDPAAVW